MAQHKQKVFCIGFMKTGTTTMNRALTILGYQVSDRSWKLLHSIVTNDWKNVADHIFQWDALEDNPIPQIFKELDQMFPGSKFILTIRDTEKWYKSVNHHIGSLRSVMHEWVYGKGKGIPSEDADHTKLVFEQHNQAVKDYFRDRPKDLLVIDVTQSSDWETICTFLGEAIPSSEFPHANQSKYSKPKHNQAQNKIKFLKKKLLNPIKISWYRLMGYLPNPEQRINP